MIQALLHTFLYYLLTHQQKHKALKWSATLLWADELLLSQYKLLPSQKENCVFPLETSKNLFRKQKVSDYMERPKQAGRLSQQNLHKDYQLCCTWNSTGGDSTAVAVSALLRGPWGFWRAVSYTWASSIWNAFN